MQNSSLIGIFVGIALVAASWTATTAVVGQSNSPRLVTYFPRDTSLLPANASIVLVFSELMNATSVSNALNISTDIGVEVSKELTGECGDSTTLTFSAPSGQWGLGNYTMRFTKAVISAHGSSFIISIPVVHFQVKANIGPTVAAVVVDTSNIIHDVVSGIGIPLSSGNVTIELSFSVSIDLNKFLDALRGKPPSKTSECEGVSVSVSLTLSASEVRIVLDGSSVVDRKNTTNRLGGQFVIVLLGMGGQGGTPGLDLSRFAPLFLTVVIIEAAVIVILLILLFRNRFRLVPMRQSPPPEEEM